MKKLLTILLFLFTIGATAQINVYKPYRTNGNVMVADSALFIGQFKLPSFSTQTLNGYAAKTGQSFGYFIPDSTLSIYAGSGYVKFANKPYVVNGLSSKLSLSGGTMTGGLIGTTANFTTNGRFAQLGIGGVPIAGVNIYNVANMTGATAAYGNFTSATIQSGVTGSANMYRSNPSTVAASFTLPTLAHFYASQGTFGAGSTVSNQYGVYIAGSLVGATNNYGIFSDIASGTGRYNFYASGTANNYMNGNLLLGTTTNSGDKLNVNGTVQSTQYRLVALNTAPASSTATGTYGEIRVTATHIYVCTSTNVWVRVALATF